MKHVLQRHPPMVICTNARGTSIAGRGQHMTQFSHGGEGGGAAVREADIKTILEEALKAALYAKSFAEERRVEEPDHIYGDNESFWEGAISSQHFPGSYVRLKGFHLTEWIPFAPGRYFTSDAKEMRSFAAKFVSSDRDEYTPNGKESMVRGGIGSIRLAEKTIGRSQFQFLGASSSGVTHEGVPVALETDDYRKVIHVIRERGGCVVDLVGRIRSITRELPQLDFHSSIPRYCLFAEDVSILQASEPTRLATTAAIMFSAESYRPDILNKSWTFCTFRPAADPQNAAEWLLDYAHRYSGGATNILTDFDEHRRLFPCTVEFPLTDIVSGTVDWRSLHVYQQRLNSTYIDTFIAEYNVAGDNIQITGSGNVVVNRSTLQNALNRVSGATDQSIVEALKKVAAEIEKSKNQAAAETFDSFNEELAKPQPRKSLLKTLWQGTLDALPALKDLPGIVASVSKLFM